MPENIPVQALDLVDRLDRHAEEYGEFRMASFTEEDADLLRKALSQLPPQDADAQTVLLLFIGWQRSRGVIELSWDKEKQAYTLGGQTCLEFVQSFLGGVK